MSSPLHDMSERRNSLAGRLGGPVLAGAALITLLFLMRFILDQGLVAEYFEMRATEEGLELTNQAWGLALWLLVMAAIIFLAARWLRSRSFPILVDASVGLAILVVGIIIGRSMMRLDFQYLLFDGGAVQVMSTWMVIAVLAVPLLAAGLAGWWIGLHNK